MGIAADLSNNASITLANGGGGTVVPLAVAGPKGQDGSNVLPTDTAIANAVSTPGSATAAALTTSIAAQAVVQPVSGTTTGFVPTVQSDGTIAYAAVPGSGGSSVGAADL